MLSRFVLADDVPANGESWFLARVFAQAAATGIRGVVSFADPVPRRVGGRLLFPGHVGHIYQAVGGVFTGRSTPRTMTLLPTGEILNERSKSKVRARERGHEAVERRLVALGASPPRAGQRPAAWLAQALDDIGAVPLIHGGQYRYAWAIGNRAERREVRIALPAQPYPKARGRLSLWALAGPRGSTSPGRCARPHVDPPCFFSGLSQLAGCVAAPAIRAWRPGRRFFRTARSSAGATDIG